MRALYLAAIYAQQAPAAPEPPSGLPGGVDLKIRAAGLALLIVFGVVLGVRISSKAHKQQTAEAAGHAANFGIGVFIAAAAPFAIALATMVYVWLGLPQK